MSQAVEDVSSGKSRPIKKTFEDLLSSIRKASAEEDEDDGEADPYEAYDEDDNDFGTGKLTHSSLRQTKLQQYVYTWNEVNAI